MKIRNKANIKSKILKAAKEVIAETKKEKGDDYFSNKKGFVDAKIETVFNKACKKAFGGLTFDEVCRARTVFEKSDFKYVCESGSPFIKQFIFESGCKFFFTKDDCNCIEVNPPNYELKYGNVPTKTGIVGEIFKMVETVD